MEENKTEKKFTYEQLEQIAKGLSDQVQQLSIELQKSNMLNIFKRLDYCFKVVELTPSSAALFNSEFVEKCAKEIEDLMTPPKSEEETKEA